MRISTSRRFYNLDLISYSSYRRYTYSINGSKLFSKINVIKGYPQILIDEAYISITTIVTRLNFNNS